MRNRFVPILTLALSTGIALPQQPAGRQVAPGIAVGPAGGPIYMDAYATPDPEGPTIHCAGKGVSCVVDARLLSASRLTPAHDTTLRDATAAINRILGSLAPPDGRKLCLYRSIHGPVLLWTKIGPAADGPAAQIGRRPLAGHITEPHAIAGLLGIRPAGLAGGNRKAELIWNDEIKMYQWKCPNSGTDCVIHTSLTSAARTVSHDDALAAATAEISRILDQAAARPPRPDQRLCLLFTPDGPMLAWTFTTDRPGRVVGSESSEFRRAAREALGLAP